ncbi:MAG: hypothetical protein JWO02_4601 [Solirubrobacterales bacterium]|nr:hypothetical protein [Solirubrobacterales bacterium]
MSFWRSWGAALLGASGAALAVPVGLLLVVAVAAGISGVRLGGLGQLTGGPELPGTTATGAVPAVRLDARLPVLTGTRRPARSAVAPADGATNGRGGAGTTTPDRGSGPAGPGTTTPTTTPTTKPSTGATTTPTTGTSSTPTGAPTTPQPADPLRTAVGQVQGAVAPVPLVGQPVADAVGSITDILLPPATGPRLIP